MREHKLRACRRARRAFALSDVAIAIAVVAILLLAVTQATGVLENGRISAAERSIDTLRASALNWLSNGRSAYTGLTFDGLRQEGLLPAGFSEVGGNPWGGDYGLSPNVDQVTVILTNVPPQAGDTLVRKFLRRARTASYDPGTKVFQATF